MVNAGVPLRWTIIPSGEGGSRNPRRRLMLPKPVKAPVTGSHWPDADFFSSPRDRG